MSTSENSNNKQNPLVSIHCLAYNHKDYIAQAIEGFLMQKTKFRFEIVIAEDCSTDGTREIVFDYAKKYPNLIRVVTSEENVGMTQNSYRSLITLRGKYVAYCEGDDYWIDPLKLQKQVDFLEANPDYGMVHTDLHEYNTVKKTWRKNIWKKTNYFQSGDIFNSLLIGRTSMIYACTAMVRKEIVFSSLEDYIGMNLAMGDIFMWLVISAQSKVGYLTEATAVRQLLPNSATQGIDCKKKKAFLDSGKKLLEYANSKFNVDPEILRIAYESLSLRYLELYSNCIEKDLFQKEEVEVKSKEIIIEKYLYKLKTRNRYLNFLLKQIHIFLRKNNLDYASKINKMLNKRKTL